MNNQILLHCPNCRERRDYVNMGSVTSEGYVVLKRQHGRYTLIMAEKYSIICECGYFIRVNDGKITTDGLRLLSADD